MSPRSGVIYRYQTDVNKRTGASITYDISNIGQKTPMFTSEPVIVNGKQQYETRVLSSYDPIYQNLSPELKDFIANQVVPQSSNQRAAFINKNYTNAQKQQLFSGMPKVSNTATPAKPAKPDPTAPDPTPVPLDTSIAGSTKQTAGSYNPEGKQVWIYPTGLGNNQQDYIQFEMIEYVGRGSQFLNSSVPSLAQRNFGVGETKILGKVYLPIQPTISDNNSVDWQNDTINPLQLLGAQLSLKGQQSGYTEADFAKLKTMFKDNPDIQSYLQQWFAGKAVGTNIFSRFSGAVVNPNLELLFNGPQLRPFNFNFRLSPRSEDEAKQVKGIIRFFKKGMAVRKTSQDLFLKAPNVFRIKYINGNNENQEHTSINKIKTCSLTQCSVDYTPDGSYATFYDKESTMTQYGLTLQFNELEPIFNEDYDEAAKTSIGY
jgi:hypothetical protein